MAKRRRIQQGDEPVDPEEFIANEGFIEMTPEEIAHRIWANGPNWSDAEYDAIQAWLEERNIAGTFTPALSELDDVRNERRSEEPPPEMAPPAVQPAGPEPAEQTPEDLRSDALAAATDEAAEVWGRTAAGVTPDLSSIEALVPEGLTPGEQEQFIREATQQGRAQAVEARAQEVQGATGAEEGEARQIADQQITSLDLFDTTTPDWLLQFNQGDLSEQQKRRYVDYWNDAYGTSFRDFDELAPLLSRFDGTEEEAQNFATAVLADQEPLIATAITLPLVSGERRVTYTEDELNDLRAMGFSNDGITRLVRLAGFTAGPDAIRPGAAGDTLNVGPLAALVRYFGGGEEFARINQARQEQERLEQELGLQPGQWGRMTPEERQAFREEVSKVRSGRGQILRDPRRETLRDLEALLTEQGNIGGRTDPGILGAQRGFNAGMDLYRGDQLLSYVHAIDPSLAQRVAATGGDPDKLDWRDNAAVYDILERGGVVEGSNVRLRQLESSTGFFGFFNTGRGGGGGGGGAGPVRRMVDPEAVREQMQQLWSRMFLADVSDGVVSEVTANLQQQLDDAPEGMNVDISSRIMAFLRSQDVYDELYRNKPAGMAEEEYQSQFAAGVQDVLGNELDPEALKAGMKTGEYQTAVGRAAASKKLLTNSTLRGRWAQAKQTLDQFT